MEEKPYTPPCQNSSSLMVSPHCRLTPLCLQETRREAEDQLQPEPPFNSQSTVTAGAEAAFELVWESKLSSLSFGGLTDSDSGTEPEAPLESSSACGSDGSPGRDVSSGRAAEQMRDESPITGAVSRLADEVVSGSLEAALDDLLPAAGEPAICEDD